MLNGLVCDLRSLDCRNDDILLLIVGSTTADGEPTPTTRVLVLLTVAVAVAVAASKKKKSTVEPCPYALAVRRCLS